MATDGLVWGAMKRTVRIVLFALCGLASGGVRAQDRPSQPLEPPDSQALSEALSRAIEHGWKSLHLLTRCPPSTRLDSVEVFGTGLAVWNSSRQFELPEATIRGILSLLKDAGFSTMPAAPDGKRGAPREGPAPRPATEVTCLISLELDGVAKDVVQLRKGSQSEGVRELAKALLDLARSHAARGVTPSGLADALAKVASGELAPELLALSLQRKPIPGRGGGVMLAVRRRNAEARPVASGGGFADARRTPLDATEIRALAEVLTRARVEAMPANLWSEAYTDFDISVMRWGKSVQARQFDGLTRDARGERQKAFDDVVGRLIQLNDRILQQPPAPSE